MFTAAIIQHTPILLTNNTQQERRFPDIRLHYCSECWDLNASRIANPVEDMHALIFNLSLARLSFPQPAKL